MNKSGFILFFFISLCLKVCAQYPGGASGPIIDAFLNTKVNIVLQADKKFNEAVKSAFNDYWKITPFEFIPQNQFMTLLPVQENSFFYMESHDHFAIIPGGKDNLGEYMLNDFIVYGDNRKTEFYSLGHIVKFMNDYVRAVKESKLNPSNQHQIHSATATLFNKNSPMIVDKVLLIQEADAAKISDISKVYNFNYKVVSSKEIEDAVKEKSAEFCYLSFPYIFDIETGKMLYYPVSYGKTVNSSYFKYLIGTISKNSQ
jgi:hypothetical protein